MKEFNKYKKTLNEIDYYVYALCEVNGTRRIPFYIGKGKNSRCLTHIAEAEKMKESGDELDEKTQKSLNYKKTICLVLISCVMGLITQIVHIWSNGLA
ncbi:hypothetical protein NBG77_05075 [Proteus terrae]|uniref:hypothetical protein n=1 Tax=Proteus terrae TaxID=1574161 RepID=UPI0021BA45F5|nr:hypothetical protein [Proteus terrae]MCT8262847.1 hypothetical protein [Proteus terrae]